LEALFRSTDFLVAQALLYPWRYGLAVPFIRRSLCGSLLPDLVGLWLVQAALSTSKELKTKTSNARKFIAFPCKKRRLPPDHFSAHPKPRKRIYSQSFLARAFI